MSGLSTFASKAVAPPVTSMTCRTTLSLASSTRSTRYCSARSVGCQRSVIKPASTASAISPMGASGRVSEVRAPTTLLVFTEYHDQPGDRRDQEGTERDRPAGQDRQLLDCAGEHRTALVGALDAGNRHMRCTWTAPRPPPTGPPPGKAGVSARRAGTGCAGGPAAALSRSHRRVGKPAWVRARKLEFLVLVAGRRPQLDGRVAPVGVGEDVPARPAATGRDGGDGGLQVLDAADLEVALLHHCPRGVEGGDRAHGEGQGLVGCLSVRRRRQHHNGRLLRSRVDELRAGGCTCHHDGSSPTTFIRNDSTR